MRRSTTKNLLSVGLLSCGVLALTPSCADNDSSMFLVGVLATSESACVAKPDFSSPMLQAGTMDTAFTTSYTAAVLVGNQLTQRGSREQLRTETSRVSLRGAEITLTTLDGRVLGNYSTVGTGFADAAQGDTPSYAAMFVNVIPAALGSNATVKAAKVVLAKIRVFGDTLGGTSVTSSQLDFPITICEGCLVKYPSTSFDPNEEDVTKYKCAIQTTASQTSTAEPCFVGQDQQFDCTLCSSSVALCRDPSLNKSYATTP